MKSRLNLTRGSRLLTGIPVRNRATFNLFRIRRWVLGLLLGAGLVGTDAGFAQVISSLPDDQDRLDEKVQVEFDGKPVNVSRNQLVKLQVTPAAAPVPALKYRLYPGLTDLKSGDSATLYHRAILFLRQHDLVQDVRENRKRQEQGERLPFSEQTFGELSDLLGRDLSAEELAELKQFISRHEGTIWNEIKLASGIRDCDWGFQVNDGRPLLDYISFLLPEIQDLRSLSRFLALKAKTQIASGDLDGAIETIRYGMKMSKSTEETRFLVCSLVGIACTLMMLEQVDDLIGTPDAPNLYWALESLPKPLVSVRLAAAYELEFLRNGAGLKSLQDPAGKSLSASQWNSLLLEDLRQLSQLAGSSFPGDNQFDGLRKLESLAMMLRGYPKAKRQLVRMGYEQERLDSMPTAQVMAIHEAEFLKIMADEVLKNLSLDNRQAIDRIDAAVERFAQGKQPVAGETPEYEELMPIAQILLPSIGQVLRAESRLQRRIEILKTIEGVRMHASLHGEFPDSLEAIEIVPVPRNPDSGEPFVYRKSDDGCMLWEVDPAQSRSNSLFPYSLIFQLQLKVNKKSPR